MSQPLYKQSVAIQEKVLGPEHPYVAMSLNNLGKLYDTQGGYVEADGAGQVRSVEVH